MESHPINDHSAVGQPPPPVPTSSSLLVVVLLVLVLATLALLFVWGMPTKSRFAAGPMLRTPLAVAVADLNVQASSDPVGQREPPLTEAEIVAAIQAQLPTLKASSDVKAIFADIARTHSLPPDATFHVSSAWTRKDGATFTVWWVGLDISLGEIPGGQRTGFALPVRRNDSPAAKPANEPEFPPGI